MNHDKRLPKEFIEIQVLYEKILENLEVNGEKIEEIDYVYNK